MFRRLGLICAALALFSLAGGHWTVLQTVAWIQMIHDYSQQAGSLAVAVEQTFDGQHPCPLCRKIEIAKSKERPSNSAASSARQDVKAKAVLAITSLVPVPASGAILFPPETSPEASSRPQAPLTPPPRGGTAAV